MEAIGLLNPTEHEITDHEQASSDVAIIVATYGR
jgi:hypothetical protein